MAADASEVKFVDPIPPELEIYCSICLDVFKDPQLTQCCGHHFCLKCLEQVQLSRRPCPLCKEPVVVAVLNKSLQRIINGLRVFCLNQPKGCDWQGDFKSLESHLSLDSREGDCKFVPVLCANGCGHTIERQSLVDHENKYCSKKPNCDIYDLARTVQFLVEENQTLNEKVDSLLLINQSYGKEIDTLKRQVDNYHSELRHLRSTSNGNGPPQRRTSSLGATPSPPIVPYEFVFAEYEHRCRLQTKSWFSEPFYTHIDGYKMCVRVAPQGIGNGEGTHVSVHFYLMKGDNDDKLGWPFRGAVTIQLINQLRDGDHHVQTSDFNDRTPLQYCRRVTLGERAGQGWGKSLFIAKSELVYDSKKQIQYLKDDCLKFQISSVTFSRLN
jgi:TNF receptor-associated factor 4